VEIFSPGKRCYKYLVREWRQNVLQNRLPFGNNLKKRLLHLSLLLLTDRLQKRAVVKRQTERERKRAIFIGRA